MPLTCRKSLNLALLLAATLLASGASGAEAGKAVAPKVSGLQARVAQGVKVDLAASALTTAELAALRPHYADLKPRIRSNAE